ncbi:Protein-tyrosine phosphatase [Dictyocaulus viviparus]|uniref:protein-tyrosine-phosphatase n=1 Tax=Dictyocaulus viviparus TaxID=29172 RepID=A0A0D8X7V4_DICVI|nr:Protein-tyrosine phosphatase [Dictyocaulus viviparus]
MGNGSIRSINRCKWAAMTVENKVKSNSDKKIKSNNKFVSKQYNDILCIDSTRVVLKGRSTDDDYIHASWMTMPDHFKYICTQLLEISKFTKDKIIRGAFNLLCFPSTYCIRCRFACGTSAVLATGGPLLETLEDFWHMMFCERSTVLVQLCNFVEGKHEKCRQYFPRSKGMSENYGAYKVTFKELKSDPFESVKHTVLEVDSKGQSLTVNHFAYLVWPDHTAPSNPASIVGCLKLCRQLAGNQPITVHCSAEETLKKEGLNNLEIEAVSKTDDIFGAILELLMFGKLLKVIRLGDD